MYLFGAGGHAMVVRDLLESNGLSVTGIADDNAALVRWMDFDVSHAVDTADEVIVCIGNSRWRKAVVQRLAADGHRFGQVAHHSAAISPFARVGEGSVVMAQAVINSGSRVGRHCIVNTAAVVEHECLIGDYVHLSPRSTLCGQVTVGEGAWIGAGAVVAPGVTIGRWSVVGVGSVVLHDVPDGVVAWGTPCQVRRQTDAQIKKQ